MSDADPFTITMNNREQMDPGTPAVAGWTYHHVQPVRIYYLTASILLRFATRARCWDTMRKVSVEAVKRMCQAKANRQTAERFVHDNDWPADGADDAACAPIAKFCGSPPCGGFPGPNPLQRTDDRGRPWLLRSGERRSFIHTDDTPLPNLVQRGATLLTGDLDHYANATT